MENIFSNLIEYIKSICFYIVISSFLLNMIPDETYAKYAKLFSGLLLIIFVLRAIISNDLLMNIQDYETYIMQLENTEEFYDEIAKMQENMAVNYSSINNKEEFDNEN